MASNLCKVTSSHFKRFTNFECFFFFNCDIQVNIQGRRPKEEAQKVFVFIVLNCGLNCKLGILWEFLELSVSTRDVSEFAFNCDE